MFNTYKSKKSKEILEDINSGMILFSEDNRHVRVMGNNIDTIFQILQGKILPSIEEKHQLSEKEMKELLLCYGYCNEILFRTQILQMEFLKETMEILYENIQTLLELNNIKITDTEREKFAEKMGNTTFLDFEEDYSFLKSI